MVFRVEKTSNYTVMSNYHLRDKNLSLKAKGLLSWMLSNNDDWDYSLAGIVANCKEGESAVIAAIKELQKFGYLQIVKNTPNTENNRYHYDYIVYEKPQSQGPDFQGLDFQALENPVQINTKIRNTKKEVISKDINNKNFEFGKPKEVKQNLYSICTNHIVSFSVDPVIRQLLTDFLDSLCEMKKLRGAKQFVGILNKLESITQVPEQQIEVIKYTLEHGYATFYSIDFNNKRSYGKKTNNAAIDIEQLDPTIMRHATREQKEKFKEDIANGKLEKY